MHPEVEHNNTISTNTAPREDRRIVSATRTTSMKAALACPHLSKPRCASGLLSE